MRRIGAEKVVKHWENDVVVGGERGRTKDVEEPDDEEEREREKAETTRRGEEDQMDIGEKK